jgi:16S rRNA (cytosine967-C5)-methyltransferase
MVVRDAAAIAGAIARDVRDKSVAELCAAPAAGPTGKAARRLLPSTARRRVLRGCARTVAAAARRKPSKPMPRNGRRAIGRVLLDAPCSSTGTIRRHPDIPWLKSEADLRKLVDLQTRLLDQAAALLKPGGTLVYCVCSLEPEEGEQAVAALLERNTDLRCSPIRPEEVSGLAELLTPEGDLRTLPCQLPDPNPRMAGLDGFYAARIIRN